MRKIEIEKIKNVLVNNGGEATIGRIKLVVENENVFLQLSDNKKNLMDMDDSEYDKLYRYIKHENENMRKKEIIFGLHKNGEVKCEYSTAEALATEGFIIIEIYKNGVLYGDVDYNAVLKVMFDGVEYEVMQTIADYDAIGWDDLDIATDMYDNGYLTEIGYDGVGNWYGVFNWDDVLTDFCKRWDKLNEAA